MVGSTYALVAVGFSLVYGVLELVNFANGAFYVLGAYLSMIMLVSLKFGFWISLTIAVVIVGFMGAFMDKFILAPIREKGSSAIMSIIATMGVGTVITNLLIYFYGSAAKPFPDKFNLGKLYIGDVIIMWMQIIIAILSIVVMLILSFIVYKTKIGSGMRAISQDTKASRMVGVNVNFTIMVAFFLGSMCSALAGTMMSMYYQSVSTSMYLSVNMKTFAAAVLGGVGSLPGAVVGGVIIGLLESLVTTYLGALYKEGVSFLVLIIVLTFRPAGLFGQETVDKV